MCLIADVCEENKSYCSPEHLSYRPLWRIAVHMVKVARGIKIDLGEHVCLSTRHVLVMLASLYWLLSLILVVTSAV